MIEGNFEIGLKYISIGLCTIAMLGAAMSVGSIFTALLNGIARNPSAGNQMSKNAMIGAAFAEAMGLLGFVIAFLLFNAK